MLYRWHIDTVSRHGFASDTAALARWLPGAVISQGPVPGSRAMLKGWSWLSIRGPGRHAAPVSQCIRQKVNKKERGEKREKKPEKPNRACREPGVSPYSLSPKHPSAAHAHAQHTLRMPARCLVGWLAVFYV